MCARMQSQQCIAINLLYLSELARAHAEKREDWKDVTRAFTVINTLVMDKNFGRIE